MRVLRAALCSSIFLVLFLQHQFVAVILEAESSGFIAPPARNLLRSAPSSLHMNRNLSATKAHMPVDGLGKEPGRRLREPEVPPSGYLETMQAIAANSHATGRRLTTTPEQTAQASGLLNTLEIIAGSTLITYQSGYLQSLIQTFVVVSKASQHYGVVPLFTNDIHKALGLLDSAVSSSAADNTQHMDESVAADLLEIMENLADSRLWARLDAACIAQSLPNRTECNQVFMGRYALTYKAVRREIGRSMLSAYPGERVALTIARQNSMMIVASIEQGLLDINDDRVVLDDEDDRWLLSLDNVTMNVSSALLHSLEGGAARLLFWRTPLPYQYPTIQTMSIMVGAAFFTDGFAEELVIEINEPDPQILFGIDVPDPTPNTTGDHDRLLHLFPRCAYWQHSHNTSATAAGVWNMNNLSTGLWEPPDVAAGEGVLDQHW
jgi:hypothetical protein